MRGGGVGLFGDFLFADQNRYGGGIVNSLAGPVLGSQVPPALKLTLGNLQELAAEGEARNAGRELSRFIEANMPGRSLWYPNRRMVDLADALMGCEGRLIAAVDDMSLPDLLSPRSLVSLPARIDEAPSNTN